MLDAGQAQALIERALRRCEAADGAEVALCGGELALTRFAGSVIHQNVTEQRVALSVRVVSGRRTARATTTRLDDEGLLLVTDEALQAVRRAPEDDHLLPLFEGGGEPTGPQAPAPAPLPSPDERAGLFARARDVLDGSGATLFGYAAATRGWIGEYDEARAFAVGNSRGLRRFAAPAHHALSLTVRLGEATAWAHAEAPADMPLEAETMAARALHRATLMQSPEALGPGEMTVVLEAEAAADLLGFLAPHVTGRSLEEGESCLVGRLGERVFAESVFIADDVHHPLQRGVPFDAEGVARRRVTLIEGGVARGAVNDRVTAARTGAEATGHGLPVPSGEGAHAAHLVMEGGAATLPALIASTDRGVLITRAWYTNFVDFKRALITGMTRDGTFLIEDGKVTRALRDLRFNVSLFELLGRIEALGPQGRHAGVVAPAMRVRGFRFTS